MGRATAKAWNPFHRQAWSSQKAETASASKDTCEPSTAMEVDAPHRDEAPALGLPVDPANLSRQAFKRAKPVNETLWDDAYTQFATRNPQLAEDYRKLLADVTDVPASANIADHAQAVLKQKLDQILEKQWKIQFRNRSITLRSKVDQILKILSIFKDLGSSLAGLDPVHAGLPWAGICFLIAPVLNNDEQHNAAIEGINKIAFIVSRYENLVNVFLDEESDGHDPLASQFDSNYGTAVRELYDLILTYQASAACYFNQATLMRIYRNTMKLDEWKGMYDKIVAMDAECMNYPRMHMNFKGKYVQKEMMDLLTRQEKNWSDLCAFQQTLEVTQTLAQISDISVEQDHEDVRNRLGSLYWDSGQWLLQHEDYLAWERSSKKFLWLRGSMGVGKSCLASIMIQTAVWKADEGRVLFFYCSQPQIETVDIFRSLLAQLSVDQRGRLASSIPKQKLGRRSLSLQECYDLILNISSQCLGVTIIVDAIDECADSDECMSQLTSLYAQSECIKIFVTSRLNVRIDDEIQDLKTITHLQTVWDMENYIKTEVDLPARRKKSGMTSEQAGLFKMVLKRRAWGMFRWVELELDVMLSKRYPIIHHKDVQSRLNSLLLSPRDRHQLSRAYSRIYELNTQDQSYRSSLAIKSLQWVYGSYQKISLEFLVQAVALDDLGVIDPVIDQDFILTICSNFVIVTRSGEVRFAHRSVKDFLRSSMSHEFSEVSLHNAIAASCLTFLLTLIDDPKWSALPLHNSEEVADLQLTSFEAYACLHWPFHCEATQLWSRSRACMEGNERSRHLTMYFLEPLALAKASCGSVAFRKWLSFLQLYFDTEPLLDDHKQQRLVDAISKPANIWFTVCIWGLLPSHTEYEGMPLPRPITRLNGKGRSSLVLACVNGQRHTIELLWSQKLWIVRVPLGIMIQAAARGGDLQTLQDVLNNGRRETFRSVGWMPSPFRAPLTTREARVKTEMKAAINAAPGRYGRSLNAALSSRNPQIALELLQNGAEVWLPVTTVLPTTTPSDKQFIESVNRQGIENTSTIRVTDEPIAARALDSPHSATLEKNKDRLLALFEAAGHVRAQLRNAFQRNFVFGHPEGEGPQQDRAVIDDALSMFANPTEFGTKMVQCPFCFQEAMEDDPEERTEHLIADLMPYMCTNSTCSIYGKLLRSREEWRTHVLASHEILEDLKDGDAGSLAGSTVHCPLCDKAVEGPQADLRMVDEHMGPHMENFAVKALDQHYDDRGENSQDKIDSDDSSRSGRGSARSWASRGSSRGSNGTVANRNANDPGRSSPAPQKF